MATTTDLQRELDGILLATRRADRRRHIEAALLGLTAFASAACLVFGLAYVSMRFAFPR